MTHTQHLVGEHLSEEFSVDNWHERQRKGSGGREGEAAFAERDAGGEVHLVSRDRTHHRFASSSS